MGCGRRAAGHHAVHLAGPNAHRAVEDGVGDDAAGLVGRDALVLAQFVECAGEGVEALRIAGRQELEGGGVASRAGQRFGQLRLLAQEDDSAETFLLDLCGGPEDALVSGFGQEDAASGGADAILDRFKKVHV